MGRCREGAPWILSGWGRDRLFVGFDLVRYLGVFLAFVAVGYAASQAAQVRRVPVGGILLLASFLAAALWWLQGLDRFQPHVACMSAFAVGWQLHDPRSLVGSRRATLLFTVIATAIALTTNLVLGRAEFGWYSAWLMSALLALGGLLHAWALAPPRRNENGPILADSA